MEEIKGFGEAMEVRVGGAMEVRVWWSHGGKGLVEPWR